MIFFSCLFTALPVVHLFEFSFAFKLFVDAVVKIFVQLKNQDCCIKILTTKQVNQQLLF